MSIILAPATGGLAAFCVCEWTNKQTNERTSAHITSRPTCADRIRISASHIPGASSAAFAFSRAASCQDVSRAARVGHYVTVGPGRSWRVCVTNRWRPTARHNWKEEEKRKRRKNKRKNKTKQQQKKRKKHKLKRYLLSLRLGQVTITYLYRYDMIWYDMIC